MRASGVFLINTVGNSLDTSNKLVDDLAKNLLDRFKDAAFEEVDASFTLQYRLLRSRPLPAQSSDGPPSQQILSHHHLIRLSSFSQETAYCVIENPSKGAAVVGIPYNELESHTAFLTNQMGAMWAPRLALQVQAGRTFRLNDYSIQIGAISSFRTHASSATAATPAASPGVVVAITQTTETAAEPTEFNDEDRAEARLDFSNSIHGIFLQMRKNTSGMAEWIGNFTNPWLNKEIGTWEQKQDHVGSWCKLLRMRE